jgi:hypothetical protein
MIMAKLKVIKLDIFATIQKPQPSRVLSKNLKIETD